MVTANNQIDTILDLCVSSIQSRSQTVEECLALYPAQRLDLEPLLRLAAHLQTARSLQAPAGFKAAALARLQSQSLKRAHPERKRSFLAGLIWGRDQQQNTTPTFFGTRLRSIPVIILVVLVLLIASSVGTVAASYNALPGDFLYPVKRAQENFQLGLTSDEARQASLHLQFADQRIDEVKSLLAEDRTSHLDEALSDYNDQIQAGLDIISQQNGLSTEVKSDLASKIISDVSDHEASLATLKDGAPQSVQDNIQTAIANTQKARNRAVDILTNPENGNSSGSTPSQGKPTPTATFLATATLNVSPTPLPPVATLKNSPTPLPTNVTQAPTPLPSNLQDRPTPTPSFGTRPSITPTKKPTPAPAVTLPNVQPTATHEPTPISPSKTPSTSNDSSLIPTRTPALRNHR